MLTEMPVLDLYISRGLNKQLQMGERGTAMTYVSGKVDNLVGNQLLQLKPMAGEWQENGFP